MLSISIEFLHGTFRGDPSGAANTGRLAHGEWPPSPARLFAALVAADGTRHECRVTDGSELEWLEGLVPPVIHACSLHHHQPLEPRYVVETRSGPSKSNHQEYVGRSGAMVRPGVRVSCPNPNVAYLWDADVPNDSILGALRRRAARVGYLGTSDSPVRLRVSTTAHQLKTGVFTPDPHGDEVINVTRRGDVEVLDRLFDAWREHGAAIGRAQFLALNHGQRYRSPAQPRQQDAGSVVAWLRLRKPVSGRRVTALTALFKAAVLSKHQQRYGEPDRVLHGHGFEGSGYEIARYLALPNVGDRWSRGLIHGLALWLPPGVDPIVRRRARDTALAIDRLIGPGADVGVTVASDDDGATTKASRWCRPSRTWATAFPAIHERRRKLDLEELARWCRHAGLPRPIGFRSALTRLVPGAIDLAPVEVNRPGRPGLPYSHVEIRFAEPVPGPVVIGSGRQRGLGLCVQVDGNAPQRTTERDAK